MTVDEPTHSTSCIHCGLDHKERLCPWEDEEESSETYVYSD
jgi:hypothetical protein